MDQTTLDTLRGFLIAGTILYFLILLIIAQMKYSAFIEHAKKVDPEYKENLGGLWVTEQGGGWVVGDYWFRSPLPIAIKTKDERLKELGKSHDRIIRLFWISAVIVIPAVIIILNFIN